MLNGRVNSGIFTGSSEGDDELERQEPQSLGPLGEGRLVRVFVNQESVLSEGNSCHLGTADVPSKGVSCVWAQQTSQRQTEFFVFFFNVKSSSL